MGLSEDMEKWRENRLSEQAQINQLCDQARGWLLDLVKHLSDYELSLLLNCLPAHVRNLRERGWTFEEVFRVAEKLNCQVGITLRTAEKESTLF